MTSPREGMNLRLPTPLKKAVRKLARENKRSVTKEIEHALEQHTRSFGPKQVEVR